MPRLNLAATEERYLRVVAHEHKLEAEPSAWPAQCPTSPGE